MVSFYSSDIVSYTMVHLASLDIVELSLLGPHWLLDIVSYQWSHFYSVDIVSYTNCLILILGTFVSYTMVSIFASLDIVSYTMVSFYSSDILYNGLILLLRHCGTCNRRIDMVISMLISPGSFYSQLPKTSFKSLVPYSLEHMHRHVNHLEGYESTRIAPGIIK
ncbi:hypothetical protein Tco_0431776 [Tanacetum coccineum]